MDYSAAFFSRLRALLCSTFVVPATDPGPARHSRSGMAERTADTREETDGLAHACDL